MTLSIVIFLLIFIILLLLGTPIVFCLGISSLVYLLVSGIAMSVVSQKIIYSLQSFPLLAVPLFILAGTLMNTGGITKRIFDFLEAIIGRLKGGLAQVNILASMVFAGMSGTAVADAAGLGVVEIEAMKSRNYKLDYSAAVTIASSVVGPIIPPSVVLIIYGVIAEESIGRLFLGGLLPGLVIIFILMVYVYFTAVKYGLPRHEKQSLKNKWKKFMVALPSLLAPVIILGGIVTGITTPTEAGGIAVIYSIILGLLYKELDFKKFKKDLFETAKITSKILFVVATAAVFGWALTRMQVPALLARTILSITDNKIVIILLINVILILLGTFMETISIIMILVPVLIPIANAIGIDFVHLGIILVFALMIGTMTPPYGICLYIMSDITKLKVEKIVKAVIPFFIPLIVSLIVISIFPEIVTFLPNLILGK